MNKLRDLALFLCPALSLALLSATSANAATLEWMSGQWCAEVNKRTTIEEHWLTDAGNRLLGLNRTLKDGRTTAFEFLQIDLQPATAVYLAQPGGKPATAFAQVSGGDQWVRFENLLHDFPQFIEYRGEGTTLTATIGAGEGHSRRETAFVFDRCTDGREPEIPAGANPLLVSLYVQAYNDCDLPGAAQLMHPDIQWLTINGSELESAANGKDNLVTELKSYMADGCSVRSELSQWSVNDRFVTVRETARWTTDDGAARSQSATAVYEIEDQKIRNVWYYPAVKNP